MDRRLLIVPGAVLLALAFADVGIVHWEAELYTTAGLSTHPAVDSSTLPAACDRLTTSLAAGRNVSVEGYRIAPDTVDLVVKRTSLTERWGLANTNCADRLAFHSNLQIDGQSYDVNGQYTKTRIDNTPPYGVVRLIATTLGCGMVAIGAIDSLHREDN